MRLASARHVGHYALVGGVVLAIGLLFTIGFFGAAASSNEKTRGRQLFIAIAAVLWILASIGIALVLGLEYQSAGRYSAFCPVSGADSQYASSHWSWFPPGVVCDYSDGRDSPGYGRVVAIIGLIGFAAAVVVAKSRKYSARRLAATKGA